MWLIVLLYSPNATDILHTFHIYFFFSFYTGIHNLDILTSFIFFNQLFSHLINCLYISWLSLLFPAYDHLVASIFQLTLDIVSHSECQILHRDNIVSFWSSDTSSRLDCCGSSRWGWAESCHTEFFTFFCKLIDCPEKERQLKYDWLQCLDFALKSFIIPYLCPSGKV